MHPLKEHTLMTQMTLGRCFGNAAPWALFLTISLGGILGMSRCIADEKSIHDPKTLCIASYNVSLYGKKAGEVAAKLRTGKDRQASSIASIIQTVRPDIVLLNEIDHDADASTVKLLRDLYLAVAQDGCEPIDYPYVYSAPSNTGVNSALDLNRNGRLGDPEDAWGFGAYEGQYAFAVLSRYPIETEKLRTFQTFRWSNLPNALRPIDPETKQSYYSDEVWNSLRLSSKNHVDVPIRVDGQTVHLLASHPTPPVFDGTEDRNGCRNHDEIAFWKHYLDDSPLLVDDGGTKGGLKEDATFVIVGDLNSDPQGSDNRPEAIRALLSHKRVIDPLPRRLSANESTPMGEAFDTADFGRNGEMRVDYVIPSRDFQLSEANVFWPSADMKGSKWIHASDHRMVWVKGVLKSR